MSPALLRLTPLPPDADALQRVIDLESFSYPSDEAATPDKTRFRQAHAGAFFQIATLGVDVNAPIICFINGTLSTSYELEEEAMSGHDPNGTTLCIHSVVIDSKLRRQGLASAMLQRYTQLICDHHEQVQRIALIAKTPLLSLYIQNGFKVTRLSPVVHGPDPWFELVLDCNEARRLSVIQVDAFSSIVFEGNPAAIVIMSPSSFHQESSTKWMQNVAKENNLSETAYVARRSPSLVPVNPNVVEYDLRWFTPQVEIPLCGHATLSAAYVLYEDGHVLPTEIIHFSTLSGILVCSLDVQSLKKKMIVMEFPIASLLSPSPTLSLETVAHGLGVTIQDIVESKEIVPGDLLVRVGVEPFSKIQPQFAILETIPVRVVVATSEAPFSSSTDELVDFQSRVFAPRIGVLEDPVTGSTHCALAPYWSNILNKTTLLGYQACPLRGGYVTVELVESRKDRVVLKGEAVISKRGVLMTRP